MTRDTYTLIQHYMCISSGDFWLV